MTLIFLGLVIFALFTSVSSAQGKNETILPKIVTMPPPEYPRAAKDAGVGGDVYILVLIDKKGRSKVVDSYGPMAPCSDLDDPLTVSVRTAAVDAAKKAVFVPAMYNGRPVEKGIRIKYVFDVNEKRATQGGEDNASEKRLDNITPPVPIKMPKAHYPENWGQIGGLVSVKMVIREDGLVHYAAAISGHRELRRPAVEAACKSIFEPATLNGKPIKVEWVIERNFYYVYIKG